MGVASEDAARLGLTGSGLRRLAADKIGEYLISLEKRVIQAEDGTSHPLRLIYRPPCTQELLEMSTLAENSVKNRYK